MMICKADFEELFPHIFKPQAEESATRSDESSYLASERRRRTHYGRAASPQLSEMAEGPEQAGNSIQRQRELASLL